MIEVLILHTLLKNVLTMYGIRKRINDEFSVFLKLSVGTLKPALVRLENGGYVLSQKTMSKGGRPSVYYSLTGSGKKFLVDELLKNIPENPVQFLTMARIRLYCSDCLDETQRVELIKMLKLKAESLFNESKKLTESKEEEFYPRMILDNLSCDYKNFISLLEGFIRAGNH